MKRNDNIGLDKGKASVELGMEYKTTGSVNSEANSKLILIHQTFSQQG